MLEKGDCKNPNHREYKIFRRRFIVSFPRFSSIVQDAREWTINNETEKKFGDIVADCSYAVSLELKTLGCLRMSAKGVCFDLHIKYYLHIITNLLFSYSKIQ